MTGAEVAAHRSVSPIPRSLLQLIVGALSPRQPAKARRYW
jgi:hypothetical protein